MSLVFGQVKRSPQTHIFLIGVGDYPFLRGGKNYQEQMGEFDQLDQLTSPQVTIETLYNTFMELHLSGCWIRPLGSVEIVMSPTSTGRKVLKGLAIEKATSQNIKDAYYRWRKRCDTHKENVAIFYYCGHGIAKEAQYLFSQDFGQNTYQPWADAFNFDRTRSAFHTCKAQTQIFLVDACSEVSSKLLEYDLIVNALEDPRHTVTQSPYSLTLQASAHNESAYGRHNHTSIFGQAIINGLKGQVARNQNNKWLVSTDQLSSEIYKLLRSVDNTQGYTQRCSIRKMDGCDIIILPGPPRVKVKVTCDPTLALKQAELRYVDANNQHKKGNRSPQNTPWDLEVDSGVYRFEAKFKGSKYKDSQNTTLVVPPSTIETLRCK